MEYLDGEGTAASRATIATHLASCAACLAIAAEQRGISEHAQAWTVGSAPGSLQPPAARRARVLLPIVGAWRPSRSALAGLSAAAVLLLLVSSFSTNRFRPAGPQAVAFREESQVDALKSRPSGQGFVAGDLSGDGAPESPKPQVEAVRGVVSPTQGAGAPRAPMVIRTATLRVVAKEFSGVRAAVEGIVAQAGGFVDQMTVTGENAAARELRGTLRVPGDRMAATLASLRAIGQVVEDTQGSEDVTDQIVDLDARLASARATEKRLADLLANRTGKLSDVLEVEREITRVRLDIERLDAEKTNMGRRVSYATITLSVVEERKGSGPLSFASRIRVATADGLESAVEFVTATLLFVLRAGPTLVLLTLAAGVAWLFGRRMMKTLRLKQLRAES